MKFQIQLLTLILFVSCGGTQQISTGAAQKGFDEDALEETNGDVQFDTNLFHFPLSTNPVLSSANSFETIITLPTQVSQINDLQLITTSPYATLERISQTQVLYIIKDSVIDQLDSSISQYPFDDSIRFTKLDQNNELLTYLVNFNASLINPSTNNGGSPTDSDGDGVLDVDDLCPDVYGPSVNSGCPITGSNEPLNLCSNGLNQGESLVIKKYSTTISPNCENHSLEILYVCSLKTDENVLEMLTKNAQAPSYPYVNCVDGNSNSGSNDPSDEEIASDDENEFSDEFTVCKSFAESLDSKLHGVQKKFGKAVCSLSTCYGQTENFGQFNLNFGEDKFRAKYRNHNGEGIIHACYKEPKNDSSFESVNTKLSNLSSSIIKFNKSSIIGNSLNSNSGLIFQISRDSSSTSSGNSLTYDEFSKKFSYTIDESKHIAKTYYHDALSILVYSSNNQLLKKVEFNLVFSMKGYTQNIALADIKDHKIEVFNFQTFNAHSADKIYGHTITLNDLFAIHRYEGDYEIETIECEGTYGLGFAAVSVTESILADGKSFTFTDSTRDNFGPGDPNVKFECQISLIDQISGQKLETREEQPLTLTFK